MRTRTYLWNIHDSLYVYIKHPGKYIVRLMNYESDAYDISD